jgi:hypothetical protein
VALIVLRRNHEEERSVDACAPAKQPTEVRGGSDPLAPSEPGSRSPGRPRCQAPSLFRPFCRRRLSTRRPPFVRMRTRKPCVRRRFRLFGWNVRFIVGSPSTGQRVSLEKGSVQCQTPDDHVHSSLVSLGPAVIA